MIKLYADEAEIPEDTINKWVWPRKVDGAKNGTTTNPQKSHTKPETKIQISEIANEIKSGSV
jgi:hypothetical protein